ncbi:tyrosine-protein kinase Abl isoform X1 [Vespula squamosa]|uniref:Tyrosine-protein kinase Abl isoform X1 n=1 Tax=Vespula squamosa TaxID=30214 RepID=A0ABD2A700_VESSQ
MGAQQTKDRIIPAGSTVRQTRKQPRNLKESRIIGSNIFTEHSEALLQSRPLPHIPALPEGDPPSSSNVQPISQQANIQQHTKVEKQLQGGGEIPLLAYKKSQTGSTGNIHGLVLVSEQMSSSGIAQDGASSVTKLSTFVGGLSSKSNSNIVQMRRSTNKKGKQAPAPPKRTSLLSSCSSFRDSAYQEQDQQNTDAATIALDDATDLNGIDKIFEGITRDLVTMATQSITTGGCEVDDDGDGSQGTAEPNFVPQPSTSPEPVSNIPCNQKQIKTRPYPSKEVLPQKLVHVGALEVQNVKRAINRYGTLPKGARIGAYLESLRQSGMPSNQENIATTSAISTVVEQHDVTSSTDTPQHRSLSPRQNNLRNQPQMTRSNSSSGVVNTYQPPNSPRSRTVGIRKNNTENIGLRTFRGPNNTGFRTASPSRSVQPTLADLEFPPPPIDLPPPPDEIFNPADQCDLPPPVTASPNSDISHIKTTNSPVSVRKLKAEWKIKDEVNDDQDDKNNDVRNVEPSVKEASSRFGVNLRRRETTSEVHCAVNKSLEDKKTILKTKEVSSNVRLESTELTSSPEEAPPPPPPPPPPPAAVGITDTFESKPGMKEMLELKLVNEIKQSADMKHGGSVKKSGITGNVPSLPLDPASQLLSELCASFSMDTNKHSVQNEYTISNLKSNDSFSIAQDHHLSLDKHSTHKEIDASSPITESVISTGNIGFKLKKVDKRNNPQKEETGDNQIIDFKARLRKVDNAEKDKVVEDKTKRFDDIGSSIIDSSELGTDDQVDDKRRSTGSISSLKKLWENKEASCDNQPLSPKLSVRGVNKPDMVDAGEDSPEDHSGASTRSSTSKGDTRVWPPSSTDIEKPVVPAKPLKPLVSSTKHFGSSIYATPNCNKSTSQTDEDANKQTAESKGAVKHSVIEISNVIENSILNLRGSPTIIMASWLQLSDKVGLLHGMCISLTDTAIAPHARFQFRDLLTRLELQARQLRAAGTRNIAENTRLLSEVQNTIKDVINTVQR